MVLIFEYWRLIAGTIDSDYNGEWMVPVKNGDTKPITMEHLSKSDYKVARTCEAKLYFRENRNPDVMGDDPYLQMLVIWSALAGSQENGVRLLRPHEPASRYQVLVTGALDTWIPLPNPRTPPGGQTHNPQP
ncbi:MAG: hypothetical protein ACR2GJ_06910 [Gemmatimonadaceae bacterium]|jgi:hypothetical protein